MNLDEGPMKKQRTNTAELLKQLKTMTNSERFEVIEEASRLIRAELFPVTSNGADDPILRIAGSLSGEPLTSREIDEILYGKMEKE
jgi:hypothetical protein